MIVLTNGDKIQGHADVTGEVDYTFHGLDNNVLMHLAEGQLPSATADLYTADSGDVLKTIILVNTGSSTRVIDLFYLRSGSVARRIIPKQMKLSAGYSLHTDGEKFSVVDTNGRIISGGDIASTLTNAATDSITDADHVNFLQVATASLKKITWSNIKSALRTYFDTLYSTTSHTHTQLHDHANKTDLDNYDPANFAASDHNHDGTYEPVLTKNTAFNKNFGSDADTVTEGDDVRLSDARTPVNNSVTYQKIHGSLKNSVTDPGATIDWNSAGVFRMTMTADTTFAFINLQLNKAITIILTGDFVATWPSYMDADHLISGEYDGTTDNYIQIHCTNATSGSEEVWWTIKTKGA